MPLEIFLPKLSGDRYQSSDITFGYLGFSVYVFGGVFFFLLASVVDGRSFIKGAPRGFKHSKRSLQWFLLSGTNAGKTISGMTKCSSLICVRVF